MTKSLKCPFCGGKPVFTFNDDFEYSIKCLSCGASSWDFIIYRLWNKEINKEIKKEIKMEEKKIEKRIIRVDGKDGEKSYQFGEVEINSNGNIDDIRFMSMASGDIEGLLQKYESVSEAEYKKIVCVSLNGDIEEIEE